MDLARLVRIDEFQWQLPQHGAMRVPGVVFADEALVRDMDDKVYEQVANVATLPGIVKALVRDARCALGIRVSDRRRRRVRSRRGRRGVGGRRGLRYFVRSPHVAHGAHARARSSR